MMVDSLRSDEGGPSRSVPALAKAIADLGADIELWTLPGHEMVVGLRVRRFESSLQLAGELKRQDRKSLVVHDNGLWRPYNMLVCRTTLNAGIRYVVSPRGMLEPWSLGQAAWKKKMAWWLYQERLVKGASMLHATGALEAENLKALGLKVPVVVLPNGVEIPHPMPNRTNAAKSMLYLSRLHTKKGIEMLLEAWKQLNIPDWRLRIAGCGTEAYEKQLNAFAAKLDLGDSVEWLGELQDERKWNAYADADVFVLPSFSENFGIVVAEALAAGLPAITTTGTPWGEIEDKGCGRFIEAGPDALKAAMSDLMRKNDVERAEMGRRGREWMEQSFSWSGIAKRTLETYEQILAD